jgi:regulatory protein
VNAGSHGLLDVEDRVHRALEVAYRYLNRRDRTRAEVRRRLESDGFDESTVERAISSLADQGLLDDARFARLFAEDKRELEGWGSDRIRRTLSERGIDRDVIEQVIGVGADGGELERALVLLRRRFPSPPRDRRERDRALGVLLRKGYDGELALDALAAYARAPEDPDLR